MDDDMEKYTQVLSLLALLVHNGAPLEDSENIIRRIKRIEALSCDTLPLCLDILVPANCPRYLLTN